MEQVRQWLNSQPSSPVWLFCLPMGGCVSVLIDARYKRGDSPFQKENLVYYRCVSFGSHTNIRRHLGCHFIEEKGLALPEAIVLVRNKCSGTFETSEINHSHSLGFFPTPPASPAQITKNYPHSLRHVNPWPCWIELLGEG